MLSSTLHDELIEHSAALATVTIVPETSGTLYIVATPIGNLDDISARAVRVLAEVDYILCEDTRHSGRLLTALGIRARTLSMHEHNEEARAGEVIDGLRAGRDYALISDAGTPLISDPGYRLVNSAAAAGLRVSPVPGACAAVAALSVSGLPTDRFCFLGFLPARKAARRKRLEDLTTETGTLVFYETGRRLESMLLDCAAVLGACRSATVAREMTKVFETVYRDTLADLARIVGDDPDATRGECVVIVEGGVGEVDSGPQVEKALRVLLDELPASAAARTVARLYPVERRAAYALALKLSRD